MVVLHYEPSTIVISGWAAGSSALNLGMVNDGRKMQCGSAATVRWLAGWLVCIGWFLGWLVGLVDIGRFGLVYVDWLV